jgi:hypothetical protein
MRSAFAVRLQADDAIDDVGARFLEPARPLNVIGLVKAGAQFHDGGDLFAGGGRVHERLDHRGIAAGAIERDLDGEDLRILRGVFDEFDDRIEAFVRMMQEHVLFAHHVEDPGVGRQRRITHWLEDAVLQLRESVIGDERREVGHRERAVQPVEIHFAEIERTRGAIRGNLSGQSAATSEADGVALGSNAAVPARCCEGGLSASSSSM